MGKRTDLLGLVITDELEIGLLLLVYVVSAVQTDVQYV